MYVFMYIYTDTHTQSCVRRCVYIYCIETCMYIHTPEVALSGLFSIIDGCQSLRRVAIHHPSHLPAVLTLQRPLPTIFSLFALDVGGFAQKENYHHGKFSVTSFF